MEPLLAELDHYRRAAARHPADFVSLEYADRHEAPPAIDSSHWQQPKKIGPPHIPGDQAISHYYLGQLGR
jgi:hypothetical protein